MGRPEEQYRLEVLESAARRYRAFLLEYLSNGMNPGLAYGAIFKTTDTAKNSERGHALLRKQIVKDLLSNMQKKIEKRHMETVDSLILKAVNVYNECMQPVEVVAKNGMLLGRRIDSVGAIGALSLIARLTGAEKQVEALEAPKNTQLVIKYAESAGEGDVVDV